MSKIPKVLVGYLPANRVAPEGTSCGTCRDFIRGTSECMIATSPAVDAHKTTCIMYLLGKPHEYGRPLRIIDNNVIGVVNHAPTKCGNCEYYLGSYHSSGECQKVGDSEHDHVDFGGCCNGHTPRDKNKRD